MSYEYSSEQAQLDFPNPYRIENILWGVRASILLVCSVALMFPARKHPVVQAFRSTVASVAPGVVLLVMSGRNSVRLGQLFRVFIARCQSTASAA